ncbi:MAG: hypothetical protein GTO02_21585 [Candidatus Dadabacteria bacterium]|nr:hypothetical protein [Candidatus Dadabacteria bacterium]
MDSEKMEQNFKAIYMAFIQDNVSGARHIFESTIKESGDEIVNQAIEIALSKDAHDFIKEIEKLKS